MRLIDLSLDQLTHFYVNFCTTLFLILPLLLSFVSESVPKMYRERDRERAIQKTYRAKNDKEPIQHKKGGNTIEREK